MNLFSRLDLLDKFLFTFSFPLSTLEIEGSPMYVNISET